MDQRNALPQRRIEHKLLTFDLDPLFFTVFEMKRYNARCGCRHRIDSLRIVGDDQTSYESLRAARGGLVRFDGPAKRESFETDIPRNTQPRINKPATGAIRNRIIAMNSGDTIFLG